MTDVYVATLPGTALGAIGGLVQRLVDRPARGAAVVRLVHARDRAA